MKKLSKAIDENPYYSNELKSFIKTYVEILRLRDEFERKAIKSISEAAFASPREAIKTLFANEQERFRKKLEDAFRPFKNMGIEATDDFIDWLSETPFLRALRIVRGNILNAEGSKTCPFCGDVPRLAFLDKNERKRFLHCISCGQSWLYYRLKCPFCGNTDQEKLIYLSTEDDPSIRLDACEKCKKYIKNFDLSKRIPEHSLEVEHLLSLQYDASAEELGYKTPSMP